MRLAPPHKRTDKAGIDSYLRQITFLRERVEDFKKYPFSIPAIASLESLEFHPKVTFFVGENGSGKSTLVEAIAVAAGFHALLRVGIAPVPSACARREAATQRVLPPGRELLQRRDPHRSARRRRIWAARHRQLRRQVPA